jgi:hypothetical protein
MWGDALAAGADVNEIDVGNVTVRSIGEEKKNESAKKKYYPQPPLLKKCQPLSIASYIDTFQ